MIVKQILLDSSLENVKGTVTRICLLILGCKGFNYTCGHIHFFYKKYSYLFVLYSLFSLVFSKAPT